ncbi:thiamine/thiamine pyrophosphate ABC transporter permease ThiP [Pasteurellaceae bacterium Orientalotternb1]|nr:thiamine/thiamine pyrophosphate ABC transporter permease ThiP [Pasteurellaceae bacterium Orientalotternb1]
MLRRITKISAWSVYFSVLSLYLFSLWALFEHRSDATFWSFHEVGQILKYSLLQAGLSAIFSTLFGILLARSFFYLNFKGKNILYKIITFAWALPSLVVIFAVIGVWGNSGWLAQMWQLLGLEWQFQLYGLQGILLAHLFFNIPLVAKYVLEGLSLIPSSQHQLAAQLNLCGMNYFRIVELPILKGILPYAFTTIFLICFTSFPIVLILGGGPKYSTLEVAIYQAVTFEFDFAKAVMLIMTQILVGIGLQILMDFATKLAFQQRQSYSLPIDHIWKAKLSGRRKWGLQAVISILSFTIVVPILHVIWTGLSVSDFFSRLANPLLWEATLFSLLLSLIATLTVILIAYIIALEVRLLAYRNQKIKQSFLAGVTTYPLIMPVFMLAVGLFLLLINVELSTWQLLVLVGVCNGLMLLPYIYRLIFTAMWEALVTQDKLARSLGLTGLRRWWIVEKTYLIRPLRNAFALAMASSLGSFAVIAFFGSPDFSTLPYLLYQQLGSYRMDDAAVTALVLMVLAFLPFLLIEQKENR